ncbi:MAG: PKD domain-containing protein [Myxococcota bacterium]
MVDGTLFTVSCTKGTLLASDVDPGRSGLQVSTTDGAFTFTYRASTSSGEVTLRAEAVVGGAAGTTNLTLEPGAAAGVFTLHPASPTLPADAAASVDITSDDVVDAYGNVVADGTMFTVSTSRGTLAVDDADGSLDGAQVVTVGGQISFRLLAGTSAGTATLSAVSVAGGGSAVGNGSVRLLAGALAGPFELGANPQEVRADGYSSTTVTSTALRDTYGNPVENGTPFTVTTTRGQVLDVDIDPNSAGVQVGTLGGVLSYRVGASLHIGTATTRAELSSGTLGAETQFGFTEDPPSGLFSMSAGSSELLADGSDETTVTSGVVRTEGGRATDDGTLVTLSTSLGVILSEDADETLPGLQVSTSAGVFTARLVTGTTAGVAVIAASSVSGTASGSTTVTFVAGDAHRVTVTGPGTGTPAGGQAALGVQVVDRYGNATRGSADVCITVTGGDPSRSPTLLAGSLTQVTAVSAAELCGRTSSATGSSTLKVRHTIAEPVEVTARSTGLPGSAPLDDMTTVPFVAAPPSRLLLQSGNEVAAACAEVALEGTLVDAYGNAAVATTPPTVALSVRADRGDAQILAANLVGVSALPSATVIGEMPTSDTMQLIVTLDNRAELEVRWASDDLPGTPEDPSLRVPFEAGPLSPASSLVTTSSTRLVARRGSVTITVLPRDECGASLAPGQSVSIDAGAALLSAVEGRDDGSYLATLRTADDTCPLVLQVVATVNGQQLPASPVVEVVCADDAEAPLIDRTANSSAALGVPYAYDADGRVSATGFAPIRFVLLEGPVGFDIDPETGRVDWLPSQSGSFVVSLRAENDVGNDVYTYEVVVGDEDAPPPMAIMLVSPSFGDAPLVVRANGWESAAAAGLQLVSWRWDFGDGSPLVYGAEAEHTFVSPGGRVVRLVVRDELGREGTAGLPIIVGQDGLLGPRARIVASGTTGDGSLSASFACDCEAGSFPIVSYLWTLGDGFASDLKTVSRTFGPGGYEVWLTVTDEGGLAASDHVFVSVSEGGNFPPVSVVAASPTHGVAPLEVRFTADVGDIDGRVVQTTWRMPDGTLVPGEEASYTFTDPGIYFAGFTATDDEGLVTESGVEVTVTDESGGIAPAIVSAPRTAAQADTPYQYDDDGLPAARGQRPLSWSLGKRVGETVYGKPEGMSIDPSTGELRWTPTPGQSGTHAVTLVAQNTAGFARQEFEIVVSGVDAGEDSGCTCADSGRGSLSMLVLGAALLAPLRRRRRRHHGERRAQD